MLKKRNLKPLERNLINSSIIYLKNCSTTLSEVEFIARRFARRSCLNEWLEEFWGMVAHLRHQEDKNISCDFT